ncbi:hypothetical protein DL93DRAFT_2164797 [Clavulina sp. PMI_390]|nr:hypothetical protein DL93DRAFT_2164797 [Clavulina sp. PMI_390]
MSATSSTKGSSSSHPTSTSTSAQHSIASSRSSLVLELPAKTTEIDYVASDEMSALSPPRLLELGVAYVELGHHALASHDASEALHYFSLSLAHLLWYLLPSESRPTLHFPISIFSPTRSISDAIPSSVSSEKTPEPVRVLIQGLEGFRDSVYALIGDPELAPGVPNTAAGNDPPPDTHTGKASTSTHKTRTRSSLDHGDVIPRGTEAPLPKAIHTFARAVCNALLQANDSPPASGFDPQASETIEKVANQALKALDRLEPTASQQSSWDDMEADLTIDTKVAFPSSESPTEVPPAAGAPNLAPPPSSHSANGPGAIAASKSPHDTALSPQSAPPSEPLAPQRSRHQHHRSEVFPIFHLASPQSHSRSHPQTPRYATAPPSRARTNSMRSLSRAFAPKSISVSASITPSSTTDSSGPPSPTLSTTRSTRSMFSLFPTSHSLFTLSRSTSFRSMTPSHLSTSSSVMGDDAPMKSSPVSAQVTSADPFGEDDDARWIAESSRAALSAPVSPTHTKFQFPSAPKAPSPLHQEGGEDVPSRRIRMRGSRSIGSSYGAQELLHAVQAREQAEILALLPALEEMDAYGDGDEELTGLIQRLRSSTLPSSSRQPSSSSNQQPMEPPSVMVTSPSTSPKRLAQQHNRNATLPSSLSPPPSPTRNRNRQGSASSHSTHHLSASSPRRSTINHLQPPSEVTPGAMPALHPALAAVERSSRLLKSTVACAVCGDVGKDFPRCGKCGEAWCSRECRMKSLAGKKRHVCGGAGAGVDAPTAGTAAAPTAEVGVHA